ncbi:hypothetical protein HY991_04100 [Candidatus Micrarchaeota archaeon]|nr:hypothetical protein [Candidatus Micrarchaeota archaeon]
MDWGRLLGLVLFLILFLQLASAIEEKVIMGDSECIKVVGKNYVRWYCYPLKSHSTTTTTTTTTTTEFKPITSTTVFTRYTTSTKFSWTTTSTPAYSTTSTQYALTPTTSLTHRNYTTTTLQQTTTSTTLNPSQEFPSLPAFGEAPLKTATRSISSLPEPVFGEALIQFNYAGWNLFSLPRTPLSPLSASALLSSHTDCKNGSRLGLRVFQWNAGKQAYEVLENNSILEAGAGYWIKVAGPCKIFFQGTTFDSSSLTPYQLKPGFNLIGAPSQAVSFEEFAGACIKANGPLGTRSFRGPYFFDTAQYQYNLSSYLEPGRGYFVFVNSSCTLKPKLCVYAPPRVNISPSTGFCEAGYSLNYSISVTDNSQGCGETLYSLSASVPISWNYVFSKDSLPIAAGATASVSVSIFSPLDTSAGDYVFSVEAANHSLNMKDTANASFSVKPKCVRATPSIAVTPVVNAGQAGETLNYSIAVANNDKNCGETLYSLSASVPGSWSHSFSQDSLSISSGASASTSLSVASASDAVPGDYSFLVKATNISLGVEASASVTHSVKSRCVRSSPSLEITPPTASGDILDSGVYSLKLTNNDVDCGSTDYSISATGYPGFSFGFPSNLSLSLASGSSVSFQMIASSPSISFGNYLFTVFASSASGNASVSGSFQVVCERRAPSVEVIPEGQAGDTNAEYRYLVNIENRDYLSCVSQTYWSAALLLEEGWRGRLDSNSLNIPSRSTGQTFFYLRPYIDAIGDRFYWFSIAASNPALSSAQVESISRALHSTRGLSSADIATRIRSFLGISPQDVFNQGLGYFYVGKCIPRSPSISVSPFYQQGDVGLMRAYSITVTNNDRQLACGSQEFYLSVDTLFNNLFTYSFSANPLTVPGRSSKTTALYVTPNAGTPPGDYSFYPLASRRSPPNEMPVFGSAMYAVRYSDACQWKTCPNYCSGNTLYYKGSCSNGYCSYQTQYCPYGCDSVAGACKSSDSCAGVSCPDYCSGDSRFYNGKCVQGTCYYNELKCNYGCSGSQCNSGTGVVSVIEYTPSIENGYLGSIHWTTASSVSETGIEFAYRGDKSDATKVAATLNKYNEYAAVIAPKYGSCTLYVRAYAVSGGNLFYSEWKTVSSSDYCPAYGTSSRTRSLSGSTCSGDLISFNIQDVDLVGLGWEGVKFFTIGSCLDDGWLTTWCAFDLGTTVLMVVPTGEGNAAGIAAKLGKLAEGSKLLREIGSAAELAQVARKIDLVLEGVKGSKTGVEILRAADLGLLKIDFFKGEMRTEFKELTKWFIEHGDSTITRLRNAGASNEMLETIAEKGARLDETIFSVRNSKIVAWLQDGPAGWGWKHIVEGNHHNQIKDALRLSDNDAAVKDVIKQVLNSYDSVNHIAGESYEFIKHYSVAGEIKNIIVVVSDSAGVEGRIITAYPIKL